MRLSLSAGGRLFGAVIVLGCLAIAVASTMALHALRVGGSSYDRIVAGKDATADILPPPLYVIEPFLEANRLVLDPKLLPEVSQSFTTLKAEFDTRRAFWKASPEIGSVLKDKMERAASQADTFWQEALGPFLSAARAGNRVGLEASLAQLAIAYKAQRQAVDDAVTEANRAVEDEIQVVGRDAILWQAGMYGTALFVLLLVSAGIIVAHRGVVVPILGISDYMGALAIGDFNRDVPFQKNSSEVGDMARAVAHFRSQMLAGRDAQSQADHLRVLADDERARSEEERRANGQKQAHVVDALATELSRLARGDLTTRLSGLPPEYRKLEADFNLAVSALNTTIATIKSNVESMQSASAEIQNASNDLARRTEHQAASLEESTAALNEITSNVDRTALNANHADTSVRATQDAAEKSRQVVGHATQSMSQIQESAGEIGQIIGVIDEMAFQTNLLALNAGVEAARAGEAGRGFAVVASEVRALAQRSAEASREIRALISKSVSQVSQGVVQVNDVSSTLLNIAGQISEVSTSVSAIAAAAKEQSVSLSEVNTAVYQMDEVTQHNAAIVEQFTAASHSLAEQATELATLVAQFVTDAKGGLPRHGHRSAA